MKKTLLLTVIAIFVYTIGYSQTSVWTKTSETKLAMLEKVDRTSTAKEFQTYNLNLEALKSQLKSAPSRESQEASNLVISFPDAKGNLQKFRIYESSVLAPELAKEQPSIQSYIGQGIDDPTASMSLTTTIFGLHTMTISANGTYYIDPYTKDLQNYMVYDKSQLTTSRTFQCLVEDKEEEAFVPTMTTFASDGKFRTYRLAMACTVEYAAFHIAAANATGATDSQKKDVVLAAMAVTVARVNTVYERDMSLRMQLVATNRNVIYVGTDPNSDPFDNDTDTLLIGQSQTVIDNLIGSANYDIGHTVSTGGGGLAQSPSVCVGGKARGITGAPSPVGDPFDIDYVAHEIGHQFGASHTFNNSCGGNRQGSTAVEPGSGSTIMGYAGICAPNVQGNSDTYFHAVSIGEMVSHITGNGNCVAGVNNANLAPFVAVTSNYTIPRSTPFVLRGGATDSNGDVLTYCWEQVNAGANTTNPTPTTTASVPNFRSRNPSISPNRYMPALESVLAGNLATDWEIVPSVVRSMTFAQTVRDNRSPNGGQTSRRDMTVTFNAASGPFAVTSQNTDGISWTQNTTQTVTWNVANTTAAPISTANVRILLSTDGGLTYPTVLVASTPNDGSEAITVPNIAAPFCRIMVEAIGNIYYSVNSKTFAIGYTVTNSCNTYSVNVNSAIPDAGTQYSVAALNIPANTTISSVKVGTNITHTYIGDLQMVVQSPTGTQALLWQNQCSSTRSVNLNVVFSDSGSAPVCASPTVGTVSAVDRLSVFNGENSSGNWLLGYVDLAAQDTGTLNSWSVEICTQTVTLNTENFGLANFKIYPNPNNGNFTVQFDSNSGNDIKVDIYDIRGRLIYGKSFESSGLFSQNLDMNNVQSGIYMVTVQDGDRKETKKIVIQ